MKRLILFITAFLIWQSLSWCQEVSKVGTTAAPFLQIGVGSRATALGEAYTAIPEDVNALYWNPSSLDWFTDNQVSFNYSDWFAGMKFINAAGAIHLGEAGSFGISVTSLTTPYMLVTTVDYPDGIGTKFNAADVALGVSYAKKLMDRFSFGATFKYINRRIWEMNASAFAMDLGILYQLPWENIKLGMSILNFGSKLQMQGVDAIVFHDLDPSMAGNNDQIMADLHTKEWDLPLSLRFGLSYQVIKSGDQEVLLAADYIHPNDNFSSVNVGCEYGFMDHFFARIGYKSLGLQDNQEGLSFGGGIKYQFIGIDYAYVKMKYFDYVQQFSVNLRF
ncbi:MAG: PorV/PorQ family protein [Bacteroidetes bacterium]|nr:PorV/PorQ family protein [Bacteroidota bacterium]